MAKHTLPKYCTAKSSRTGKPCRRPPIAGGMVCATHGGRAPQVARKAEERLADLIDPDRALREAARLAYSDIRDIFDDAGNLLPVKQWPRSIAAAVSSVKVVRKNITVGDNSQEHVHEVRIWDKNPSLALIFKHLGLIVERSERGKPGDFSALSTDEKLSRIEALMVRIRSKQGTKAS